MYPPIRNARIVIVHEVRPEDLEFIEKALKETGGLTFDTLRAVAEITQGELEACLRTLERQNVVDTELRDNSHGPRLHYKLTDSYLGK